jgi:hypothetical protein
MVKENGELHMIGEEVVVAYFKVLYRHSPGGTAQLSKTSMSRLEFEQDTPRNKYVAPSSQLTGCEGEAECSRRTVHAASYHIKSALPKRLVGRSALAPLDASFSASFIFISRRLRADGAISLI